MHFAYVFLSKKVYKQLITNSMHSFIENLYKICSIQILYQISLSVFNAWNLSENKRGVIAT